MKKITSILKYYFSKIKARIRSLLLLRLGSFEHIGKVASFNIPSQFEFSGKIFFCFWNKTVVHLGDQLFFQPLIERLIEKFQITIITSPEMQDYFSSFGYEAASLGQVDKEQIKQSLLITKKDMVPEMKKELPEDNAVLGLRFVPQQPERVVEIISEIISKVLCRLGVENLNYQKDELCPDVPANLIEKYQDFPDVFKKEEKFILFNNYVASHFIGINKERRSKLEKLAQKKKNQGFSIVHIGTAKEKKEDGKNYSFVDYDLRGGIKPLMLFKIFSLDNVHGIISFDTFPMHVASIMRTKLYVVLKSREGEKSMEKFKKVFVPMASCLKDTVQQVL